MDALGFDACINRRDDDWQEQLDAVTPGGTDVDFENAGEPPVMDHVIGRPNVGVRIVLCRLIADYNTCGTSATASVRVLTGVIVFMLDRLARDPAESITAARLRPSREANLSCTESVDQSFFRDMMFLCANESSRETSQRVQNKLRSNARAGSGRLEQETSEAIRIIDQTLASLEVIEVPDVSKALDYLQKVDWVNFDQEAWRAAALLCIERVTVRKGKKRGQPVIEITCRHLALSA